MLNLSGSEFLFYGGITVMTAAAVIAVICAVIFQASWRKLREKLDQEYGKLK